MNDRLIHETTSLCRVCKNAVAARVVDRAGAVWMLKSCAQHGEQNVAIGDDAAWYESTRALRPPVNAPTQEKRAVDLGCPFDCGPCESHEQKVRLPVVTITSACNLDCPICYVHNKNDDAYHMSDAEFSSILDHLVNDHGGELDLVNLTGGEPMLHPRFMTFLEMAHARGIHRVSICSNGLSLAKDEELVKRLAAVGARIALSFDTFDEKTDVAMQGANLLKTKMRALELCEKYGLDVTLIPVMTRGMNDHEIGKIIELGLSLDCVRHLEIHTMTYTGQGGVSFDPERKGRISMREVVARIEETTGGLLRADDFVPSPCAHPLCYQIAYLLVDPAGGPPVPFTRFIGRDALYASLTEHLYLEPSPRLEAAMREAIDRLWSEDGDARTLSLMRSMLDSMFAPGLTHDQALRAGERAAKAVYVHSHMDEETFDTERLAQCCDSNCYADGRTVPVCAYNVLYREKEAHFMDAPKSWNERAGGRTQFPARSSRLPVLRG